MNRTETVTERRRGGKAWWWLLAAWVPGIAIALVQFVSANQEAAALSGDGTVPRSFLGMSLFEVFRTEGRTGIEVHPALAVLVLALPAVAFVWYFVILSRRASHEGSAR